MEEKNFSWLEEEFVVEERKCQIDRPPSLKQNLLKSLQTRTALIVVSAVIAMLLAAKLLTSPPDKVSSFKLPAMAAVLPIAKGDRVEGMLLRPVLINPGSLTKTQKIQRVEPDDAAKVMGKVKAKKDIPPNKPLLWTDLELIPQRRDRNLPRPATIYYGDGS